MAAPQLTIRNLDRIGRGVFTETKIAAGTEVLAFAGELVDVSTIRDLTHCLQVGERTFLTGTGGIDDFINHSCDPTCGVRLTDDQRVVLIALKDMPAGTEISFDYATTQSGDHETLNCLCKASNCRKVIGGFGDLPKSLQDYYIRNNAVLPFLVAKNR